MMDGLVFGFQAVVGGFIALVLLVGLGTVIGVWLEDASFWRRYYPSPKEAARREQQEAAESDRRHNELVALCNETGMLYTEKGAVHPEQYDPNKHGQAYR